MINYDNQYFCNKNKCRPSFWWSITFFNSEELAEFNNIGYSGKKLDGTPMRRAEYLNSLGKGEFECTLSKRDTGDFREEFTITRVT